MTIPSVGADEQLLIAIPHTATVSTAQGMLRGAGPAALSNATLQDEHGNKLSPQGTFHAALQSASAISISLGQSGGVLKATVPSYVGGAYGVVPASAGVHRLNVREVMQKGAFVRTRRRLQRMAKRTITWDEFVREAEDCGVTRLEAEELSAALHTAGVILHFRNHPDKQVRNTIILQPDDVIDSVYESFGLPGPVSSLLDEEADKHKQQLQRIQGTLADKRGQKAIVDANAANLTRWFNVGVLASYSGMMGGMMYLTYEVLQWDIIEPITWATGQGALIVAYFWWLVTRKEMEFETMAATVRGWQKRRQERRLRDGMHKEGTAGADADLLGGAVASLPGMSSLASAASVDDEIVALETAERTLLRRTGLLHMTRFSPALSGVYDTLTQPAGSAVVAEAASVTSSTEDDAAAAVAKLLHESR